MLTPTLLSLRWRRVRFSYSPVLHPKVFVCFTCISAMTWHLCTVVSGADSLAQQVDRDMDESRVPDGADNFRGRRRLDHPRQVLLRHLDPGDSLMRPHAYDAESQVPNRFFGLLDAV